MANQTLLQIADGGTGQKSITGLLFGQNTSSKSAVPLWYGDGSDGSHTFDGAATILGMVPSANVYTMTRDIMLDTSTINSGITILTAGFRIFCIGTLTNNGIISGNGNNGIDGGNGGQPFAGSLGAGGTGGNGSANNGGAGTNPGSSLGGNGGAGGNGGTGTGGGAATATPPTASSGSYHGYVSFFSGSTAAFTPLKGGASGGGGGGDTVNKGGGGGAGGAFVLLLVYQFSGTGTISANGGNGGNGSAGNSGGGGGGGGGVIYITSTSVSSGAISGQTITVNGGTHGVKTGTGINGNDGSVGSVFLYCS